LRPTRLESRQQNPTATPRQADVLHDRPPVHDVDHLEPRVAVVDLPQRPDQAPRAIQVPPHDARPLSAAAHAASPANTRPPAIRATAATPAPVAGNSPVVDGRWHGWKNRAVVPRRSNTSPTPSR